ncbi:unnamed protein product [Arabis nemorensis]|uniref:non-specific serine/threonine protein kinase n=1 Tax=Arabis nemorensis TaxID=586526 RepID=A0A565C929_9BRAS|nr:unnamed protein product [Arabis nemorensis]
MSCSSSSGSEGEEEGFDSYRKGGYHAVRIGDPFSVGRYIAQRKLGWGQFSTVWLAYDTRTSNYVALKIQKSAQQFAQAALHEIEFLSAAADGDLENNKCVVRLIDHFKHTGPNGQHLCMVLEFLGDSLLRLIRYNRYKGLKLDKVREICRCILTGLDYLHRELGMIHSDLKPENILLCSTIDPAKDPVRSGLTPVLEKPEGNANGGASTTNLIEKKLKRRAKRAVAKISERRVSMMGTTGEETSSKTARCVDGIDMRCKVVDFGNACWADKQFAEEIQTRQYRAPEVILKSGYSFSVDMWSFGCTAFELVTGDMLFAPNDGIDYEEDEDHLAQMMELLGKMPRKIAIGGAKSKDYFDRHGDLKRIRRLKYKQFDQHLIDKSKLTEAEAKEFAEFLRPILEFAPEKRPTAQQCLEHPWMNVRTQNNADNVEAKMNNLQIKG